LLRWSARTSIDLAAKLTADAARQREVITAEAHAGAPHSRAPPLASGVLLAILLGWAPRPAACAARLTSLMTIHRPPRPGDLTKEIHGHQRRRDSAGMAGTLRHAVGEIRTILSGVATSATNLAGSSDALRGTNQGPIAGRPLRLHLRPTTYRVNAGPSGREPDSMSSAAIELGASIPRESPSTRPMRPPSREEAAVAAKATRSDR
jgi:methyl-accepting chemotaxis protein